MNKTWRLSYNLISAINERTREIRVMFAGQNTSSLQMPGNQLLKLAGKEKKRQGSVLCDDVLKTRSCAAKQSTWHVTLDRTVSTVPIVAEPTKEANVGSDARPTFVRYV